jgi:hypothetical protein
MSVWFCIPSKRPAHEVEPVLAKWRERGYKTWLMRDSIGEFIGSCNETYVLSEFGEYPGYAKAVNHLAKRVLETDPSCDWIVTGGDDVLPDPNKAADEIAAECSMHFGVRQDLAWKEGESISKRMHSARLSTFGVMQPTGDRSFRDAQGPYIDRVAGSPWLGREWCLRINQGNGPLWPEYFHMGVDEELQAVALKQGVFWQRPDLTHFHQHWGRPRPGERMGQNSRQPAFLKRANSPAEWNKYKAIFAARKAAEFPGSEPLC